MANLKLPPGEKKIRLNFTIKEKYQNQLKFYSEKLGISMSQFVEDAILEKIHNWRNSINNESIP
jgi:hypothetical protein